MRLTLTRGPLPSPASCAPTPPLLCYEVSAPAARDLIPGAEDLARDLRLAEIVDDARSLGTSLLVQHAGRPLVLVSPDGRVTLPESPTVAAARYADEAAEEQRQREEGEREGAYFSRPSAHVRAFDALFARASRKSLLSRADAAALRDAARAGRRAELLSGLDLLKEETRARGVWHEWEEAISDARRALGAHE